MSQRRWSFSGLAVRVLAAITIASLGLVSPMPADGQVPPRVEPPVDFTIIGFRCDVEVTGERVRPDGTRVISTVERGVTDSSIALMRGQLVVRSTTVLDPDGSGRISGRWTLEPNASTGSLRGGFRGEVTGPGSTEIRVTGHGIKALRGISVAMTTSSNPNQEPTVDQGRVGGSDDNCGSGLTFTGSGSASYRDQRDPAGSVVVASTRDFPATVDALIAAVDGNPNLRLIRVVDHRAAAATRGLELAPTTELFFGNPALGTPLMQASQTTGIDLPQKMVVWEDLLGIVRVGYNAPAYLASRHRIEGADDRLQVVANALAGLAGAATGTTVEPVFDAGTVRRGAGLVTVTTERSADDAFAAIVSALDAAPPVNVAIELEHDENAAAIGLDLRPTKLVVFGNPTLGSVLMQTDQSIALDLPQKILVYTDEDGRTAIAYNDPRYIAERHDVRNQGPLLQTLAGALANFAAVGAGQP